MGGTFKPVPQPRLEVPARTERHIFSQQRRLPCDSNWGANTVKPLKGTPLPVETTLCWSSKLNINKLKFLPQNTVLHNQCLVFYRVFQREERKKELQDKLQIKPNPRTYYNKLCMSTTQLRKTTGFWRG